MSGYDEMFNGGIQRLALKSSSLAKPKQWPSHVSAMRRHTDYGGQTQADPHSTSWHSDFMVARAHPNLAPARAGNPRAAALNAARINNMHAAHRAHAARTAQARRAGRSAPAAAHVTDARRWHFQDQKA